MWNEWHRCCEDTNVNWPFPKVCSVLLTRMKVATHRVGGKFTVLVHSIQTVVKYSNLISIHSSNLQSSTHLNIDCFVCLFSCLFFLAGTSRLKHKTFSFENIPTQTLWCVRTQWRHFISFSSNETSIEVQTTYYNDVIAQSLFFLSSELAEPVFWGQFHMFDTLRTT